jgi:hypothetical protein
VRPLVAVELVGRKAPPDTEGIETSSSRCWERLSSSFERFVRYAVAFGKAKVSVMA